MTLAPTPVRREPAIVAEVHDQRVLELAELLQLRIERGQRSVDARHHRGVGGLGRVQLGVIRDVVGIGHDRRVHRVVRELQEEALVAIDRRLHRMQGLARGRVGQVHIAAVVGLEPGHVPDRLLTRVVRATRRRVVVLAVVAARPARGVAGDVHVEAEPRRVRAARVDGAQVRLARVDRAVAGLLQQQRQADLALLQAIVVPARRCERRVPGTRPAPGVQDPVRDVVTRRAHARHHGDARRRAHRAGRVGVHEAHALGRETLCRRRAVARVEGRRLGGERHREVLPAEVVDEEQDEVG